MTTAFQSDAFQNDAFQIDASPTTTTVDTHDGFKKKLYDPEEAAYQEKLQQEELARFLEAKDRLRDMIHFALFPGDKPTPLMEEIAAEAAPFIADRMKPEIDFERVGREAQRRFVQLYEQWIEQDDEDILGRLH